MNVLVNVYICALRKNNESLFPEGQLNVHTWYHSKYTDNAKNKKQKTKKNGAIAKVRTFVEQVMIL